METQIEYLFTPERQEETREDLARRKLTILSMFASSLLIAAFGLAVRLLTGPEPGLSSRVWIPVLIAYVGVEFIAVVRLWRCPGCNRRLPLDLNPSNCYECGAVFRQAPVHVSQADGNTAGQGQKH